MSIEVLPVPEELRGLLSPEEAAAIERGSPRLLAAMARLARRARVCERAGAPVGTGSAAERRELERARLRALDGRVRQRALWDTAADPGGAHADGDVLGFAWADYARGRLRRDAANAAALAGLEAWVTDALPGQLLGVILVGPTGTGKTTAAVAAADAWQLRHGPRVRCVSARRLQAALEDVVPPRVLVVDDLLLGTQWHLPSARGAFGFVLANHLAAGRELILTLNLAPVAGIARQYAAYAPRGRGFDPVGVGTEVERCLSALFGPAVADRVCTSCVVLPMGGPSRRARPASTGV